MIGIPVTFIEVLLLYVKFNTDIPLFYAEKEEMVGLTVSVPQGNRSSSPADSKKTVSIAKV